MTKTRLAHLGIATALTVLRAAAWRAEQPRAQARVAAFARRAPAA